MDDTVYRLARTGQAIRAAVAANPTVEACRAKARARLRCTCIDAKWASPTAPNRHAVVKVAARRRRRGQTLRRAAQPNTPASPSGSPRVERRPPATLGRTGWPPEPSSPRELSASDRLFLKSLRIAPDELPEVKG